MTSHATTHALADENCSFRAISLSRPIQCYSMGSNQLWQGIRPFPAFAHVVVIESPDLSYLGQNLLPTLHPGMGRRRSCAWSEQEQWSHSLEFSCKLRTLRRYPAALKVFLAALEFGSARKTIEVARWQQSPPNRGRSCWLPNHDATNRIPLRLYPLQARSESFAAPPDQWPSEKITSGIVTDQNGPRPIIRNRSMA